MFNNQIQTQQQAGQVVAPAEQTSVLATALQGVDQLVNTFAEIAKQDRKAEVARLSEANVVNGQDAALSLLKEYDTLRGSVGASKARLTLEKKYRSTLSELSNTEQRGAFVSTFKDVFGGSPTATQVKAEDEAAKAEVERDFKLAEKGRSMLAGLGREPANQEEAIAVGRKVEGAEARYADLQRQWGEEDRGWELEGRMYTRSEREYTQAQRQQAVQTNRAAAAFTVQADLLSNQILTDISKAAQSGDEALYQQTKAKYLNLIAQQKGQLSTFVNAGFTAAGGSLSSVPSELYTQTQSKLDGIEKLITGEYIRDRNVQQTKLFESQLYVDLLNSGDPMAKYMAVSAVIGAPVPNLSANNLTSIKNINFKDPTRQMYDYLTTASKVGPSATEQVVGISAPQYIRDVNNTAKQAAVKNDPLAKKILAQQVVQTMEDATNPRNKSVLGAGGVIEMHRAVATGQYDDYREEIAEQILSTGQSAEQVFQSQMETFTRTTLIPSLRLTAPVDRDTNLFFSEGPAGREVLQFKQEGGKVRIVIDESKLPSATPVAVQTTNPLVAAGSIWYGNMKSDPAAEFKRNVKKAEQDLNVMLMSYSKLTGEDASTLASAYVQAFTRVVPPKN